jgi:hypothetical protein
MTKSQGPRTKETPIPNVTMVASAGCTLGLGIVTFEFGHSLVLGPWDLVIL